MFAREKLRKQQKKLGSKGTAHQHGDLNKKREKVRARHQEHQEQRDRYMPGIGEADHPSRRQTHDTEPEFAELGLPSSYTVETLAAAGLASLATTEKRLRCGTCNDALATARNQLGAKALELKYKKANVRGDGATTRSEATLQEYSEKITNSQWRYNNSRNALVRLGMSSTDSTKYLEMTSSDLKTLKYYLENDSQELGQGYAGISWIWRSSTIPTTGWQVIGVF